MERAKRRSQRPRHRHAAACDSEQLHQRLLLTKLRRRAQMPRALAHHQHESDELHTRAEAAVTIRLRYKPLEAGIRARACASARPAPARPLREAGLLFVVEILQDWISIKPCSDRVHPAGEKSFLFKTPIMQGFIPFCSLSNAILRHWSIQVQIHAGLPAPPLRTASFGKGRACENIFRQHST